MDYGKVQEYLLKATPNRPAVMQAMERYARKNDFPIIGPIAGRFLYQMALTVGARKILELGSGFGYSAYWFSLAAGPTGHITMTDGDAQNMRRALAYLGRARLKSHFDFKVGEAIALAKSMRGPFDVILNDIDKVAYPHTIELAARLLRRGGLFITDNVIWSGRVMNTRKDKTTSAIVTFTKRLYADKRFCTTIVPIRDGLAVAVRL